MKKTFFISLFACFFLCGHAAATSFYFYDQLETETSLKNPLLIHMIFFPWNRQQQFLKDELHFNHAPYLKMQAKVQSQQNARVVMWTYSKAKEFCLKYYPMIWKTLEEYAARPVMYVDIMRWLIVYHYGGIYWQYDSIPLVQEMASYLPQRGKIRFFVETIISPEFSQMMAQEPIRKGKPEELTRVATQIFSSLNPKAKTLMEMVNFFVRRLETEKVCKDYDILYITGNAAMSEYYDRFGKRNKKIELTSLDKTCCMVNFNPMGRWRTD